MTLFNAFSGVFTVFLVAFLGYALRRKRWVGEEALKALPRFITMIVMPPFLLRSITATFEKEQLLGLLSGTLVPAVAITVFFCLAYLFSVVFAVREGRRGAFITAFAASNTLNVGLPINIALFGEGAIPYILVYFFAHDILFWTVGNYLLARDGEQTHVKLLSLESAKRVLSPPLIGFALGMALVLLDIQLPAFLDKTFKYVGDMAIALALMYIGIMMGEIRLKDLAPDRDALLVLAGRCLICPLIVLALAAVFPVPETMRNVFVLQAAMPVMLNAAILTGYYGGDVKFMTVVASLSTMLVVVTVPFWAVCLG